ncbi:RIP metalloprotease RseP [Natribacillus halophilus]|uniref:Zinc metalloprotease n=1 Tax=Natribacillus halophilus TaxID=549003 RepID=A0A1G8PPZ8_9BACI|nr:RIP metalloprotease RseP [Natribacillus halophilus]SDI94472.1 regulator of sigma E protease [Natribacillus halophilus]
MQTLIAIIVIFGLIIAIHEWGHLYVAKKVGILCREFAIGFGPKLFTKKKNETVYTLRLLPLGGFVRMAGEDPELVKIKPGYEVGLTFHQDDTVKEIIVNNKAKHPDAKIVSVERADLEHQLFIEGYSDDEDGMTRYDVHPQADMIVDEEREQIAPWDRQFGSKKPWKKASAIFAGPVMNFVLAFILFVIFFTIQGIPQPEAANIEADSPAEEAGIVEGDRIVSIEGDPVEEWTDVTQTIQQMPEEEVTLLVERADGDTESFTMVVDAVYEDMVDAEIGQIGIEAAVSHSFMDSVVQSVSQIQEVVVLIFEVLQLIFTGQFSLDYLAGPVGIYDYTGEVMEMGTLILFSWAGMLSVNIGLINLLPLPALDGGRLVFIGLEAIRRKPIDPNKEGVAHFIGFALLMLLVLMVTWNDLNRLFM